MFINLNKTFNFNCFNLHFIVYLFKYICIRKTINIGPFSPFCRHFFTVLAFLVIFFSIMLYTVSSLEYYDSLIFFILLFHSSSFYRSPQYLFFLFLCPKCLFFISIYFIFKTGHNIKLLDHSASI